VRLVGNEAYDTKVTVSSLSAENGFRCCISPVVNPRDQKVVGTVLGVAVIAVLIGIYVTFLTGGPTPYHVPSASAAGGPSANLTLQTVAAVGPKLSPNENWVSYLVRENGVWHRSTVWTLPAHAVVAATAAPDGLFPIAS